MTAFKREFDFEENIMIKVSANIRKYRLETGIT